MDFQSFSYDPDISPATYSLACTFYPVKGHFVPKTLLGNIIDELNFALNFVKNAQKKYW